MRASGGWPEMGDNVTAVDLPYTEPVGDPGDTTAVRAQDKLPTFNFGLPSPSESTPNYNENYRFDVQDTTQLQQWPIESSRSPLSADEERPLKRRKIGIHERDCVEGQSYETPSHVLIARSCHVEGFSSGLHLPTDTRLDTKILQSDFMNPTGKDSICRRSGTLEQILQCAPSGGGSTTIAHTVPIASPAGDTLGQEVCFGMIGPVSFVVNHSVAKSLALTQSRVFDDVILDYAHGAVSTDSIILGLIPQHHVEVLQELSKQQEMSTQFRCLVKKRECRQPGGTKQKTHASFDATLLVILYGPHRLFSEVGGFLEDCDICLQDPEGICDRIVPYRNPHKITGRDDDVTMTLGVHEKLIAGSQMDWKTSGCFLDDFDFQEYLSEAATPPALSIQLFKHQQQGLHFMTLREQGWCYNGHLKDIWKSASLGGMQVYCNTVNDDTQIEAPKLFRGGLLLDDMGLGKTLTIIALIASDLVRQGCPVSPAPSACCTLVVVPPPLLDMWADQISKHTHPILFRWYKHHGNQRLCHLSQLSSYNLVLTTYNTVSAEFKNRQDTQSVLFQAYWHRVVLDEAHEIRDPRTQVAKAVCSLKADRRWAATGTPIQNHLTDLKALLHYLRVSPYDDDAVFDNDITCIWKEDPDTAIQRLKHLITCLGIRRSRRAVDLPPRTHSETQLQFTQIERELYEPLETKVFTCLNRALDAQVERISINPLQALNALRLICNFGLLSDVNYLQNLDTDPSWNLDKAQRLFGSLVVANQTACALCFGDVLLVAANHISDTDTISPADLGPRPLISECAKILCESCNRRLELGPFGQSNEWCGHSPPCLAQTVNPSGISIDIKPIRLGDLSLPEFPSKIKALVNDVQAFPSSKSVVFSMWRTTLDLCAAAFNLVNIPFVRFDGNVSAPGRQQALQAFRTDPNIKVILFTISCGSVGLDLTAADRAYLMEPQWNPTVEDQAFARIHRLGQTQPVTTIRYTMSASYEERVVDVQRNKRNFADLLLGGKKSAASIGFDMVRRLVAKN